MSRRKTTSMLLAASVLLTGFSGAFVYGPHAAYGITSVDELSDTNQSGWAFDALKDLVEKYNVIEGYPDKTFRGDHQATRYEMAAALNALMKHVGKDIARLGAEKADKEDLAKLAKLQEEFKAELAALKARTDALEARAAKIEAKNEEQDNRLTILEKLKIYGDVTIGGFADIGGRGGNGTPFPGQGFTVPQANGAAAVQSRTTEGMSDGISAIGRVRVNVDYPIVESKGEGAKVGQGTIHTRIIGAFGRVSPLISNSDGGRVTTGSGMLSGVSRIAGDSSAFNEGLRTSSLENGSAGTAVTSGTNTRANLYLESAYYTQEFGPGVPVLTDLLPGTHILPDDENWRTSMKMHMGLVPWRELFQKSPYTGDETTQFQNTAIINNGALAINAIAPTVAFAWHQGLGKWHSLDVKTALSAIDVSDAMGIFGITYEAGLNYNFGWLADWMNLPGNVYVGGFSLHSRGGSNSLLTQATTQVNGVGAGLTARTFAGNSGFLGALGTDPQGTLYSNWSSPACTNGGQIPGGGYRSTAVLGPNMVDPSAMATKLSILSLRMGMNATTLQTAAGVANFFGMTQAQVSNPDSVIPQATLNNINGRIGTGFQPGTTMGQYVKYLNDTGILSGNDVYLNNTNQVTDGGKADGTYSDDDTANGFYFGVNQEIHRGAGVFFSYGVMDTGPTSLIASALQNGTGSNAIFNQTGAFYGVKEAMNGGIEIPMKALHLPWRHKDVLGVGYAMLKPNNGYGSTYGGVRDVTGWGTVGGSPIYNAPSVEAASNVLSNLQQPFPKSYSEHIIEAYYKVHINDRFSVTPNVQFIINRLGDPANNLDTVIGLRSNFTF